MSLKYWNVLDVFAPRHFVAHFNKPNYTCKSPHHELVIYSPHEFEMLNIYITYNTYTVIAVFS